MVVGKSYHHFLFYISRYSIFKFLNSRSISKKVIIQTLDAWMRYHQKFMFGLFKKKTEIEKLQETYKSLLEKSYNLSHSNRSASDKIRAEAEAVADKIDQLRKEAK